MKVNVKKITSAINKIADLTSGDKTIPGVLLKNIKNEDGTSVLKICFNEGHKALVEEIEVEAEDTDITEDYVVAFESLKRAIDNCQPSGIICVEEVVFTYLNNNIIRLSADQAMGIRDAEGNIVDYKKMATKKMDIAWEVPGANMKTSLLTRMNYDSIFEPAEGVLCDEYNKVELMDALTRVSVEKGKSIYLSSKNQEIFVSNTAHVTAVPVSGFDLTLEQEDEIRATLSEQGIIDNTEVLAKIAERRSRIHQSIVMAQNNAKALIGILNKCNSETVRIHRNDKFFNVIMEEDDEKVGVMCEMVQPSKAQIGALDRYNSLEYKTYQLRFLREFLVNNVKSALNASKNDKTKIKFELSEETGDINLIITSSNAGASIADTYSVGCEDCTDINGDITTKEFNISLQVFTDMLSQLKTDYIGLDFNIGEADTVCIRVAEIDTEKLAVEYEKGREATAKLCSEQGRGFDPAATPTDANIKLNYRINTLGTKQYTMLAK